MQPMSAGRKGVSRRAFLRGMGVTTSALGIAAHSAVSRGATATGHAPRGSGSDPEVWVSQNGTPTTNVQNVVAMAGGITTFVDESDVVVLKPNLQHSRQGYTHTEATKAMIDLILDRPGGFSGEIIVAENVHWRDLDDADNCGWAAEGAARENNWSDLNYNELIALYHAQGHANVTAVKLSNRWPWVLGPEEGQGWVYEDYTIAHSPGADGRVCRLSYPIIASAYSGRLIDTKYGAWHDGGYTGQNVRFIMLATLNNHGGVDYEDYAGATAAVKSHIGFVRHSWAPDGYEGLWRLHSVGYNVDVARAVGEAVGWFVTNMISPTAYLSVAEHTGWQGRTKPVAAHTRTIGLCRDPVTLDYWMGKHVLATCNNGNGIAFLDPSQDNNFRRTLEGCHAMGVGTLEEREMHVEVSDLSQQGEPQPGGSVFRFS